MTNKHKNYIFIRRRKKIEKRILRQGYLSLSLFPFFFHSLTRPILFNVKTDITTNKQKNYLFPSRRGNGISDDEKKMNTNDHRYKYPNNRHSPKSDSLLTSMESCSKLKHLRSESKLNSCPSTVSVALPVLLRYVVGSTHNTLNTELEKHHSKTAGKKLLRDGRKRCSRYELFRYVVSSR